jgi:hypothetical protein
MKKTTSAAEAPE